MYAGEGSQHIQHIPTKYGRSPGYTALTFGLPDGVVGSAEVDEEVPAPVPHGQQVRHGAEVHGQQAGPSPDGGHAPGGHPDVGVLGSQGLDLPVEVVGPLVCRGG